MSNKTYFQYIPPPKTAWDELPMSEKTDIMNSCVRNGIISLQDVRTAFNNYATGKNILEGIPDYQANATEFGNFLAGGGKKDSGEKMVVHQPYYAYDENGRKIDDTLYYNVDVTLPEITIIPDSMKSLAQRNADERFRQRFNRNYAEQQARDYTTRQTIATQREWENSPQKKALDLGIAAAQGVGIGTDIASTVFGGIPVYSGLKGAQALDRATSNNELVDYADAALWLSPMLTVAGKKVYDAAKPAVQRAFAKGTPAAEWVRIENNSEDVTDNLLKWLGRPEGYKPEKPISLENNLYFDFKPVQGEMVRIWRDKGVNLDRIGGNDIEEALKKRWDELVSSRHDRHTIVRSTGNGTYFLHDIIPDKNTPYGWRSIGTTQLSKDVAGNMHMEDITNNTGSVRMGKPATEHGVQEKALNAAIKVAKQEGGEGVVTGKWWLSAPKQQHVVQKYHDREVIGNTGQHTNANMVEERINADIRKGIPVTGEEETLATSMLDLRRAGDKETKTLFNQPIWLLRTPTKDAPVKSTLFDPTIIDRFGKMHIDWDDPSIFRGIAYPTLFGTGLYGTQE